MPPYNLKYSSYAVDDKYLTIISCRFHKQLH